MAGRLGAGPEVIAELRRGLAARERWDESLTAFLRGLRSQAGPRIYTAALRRLAAGPAAALFVDDTPGHVAAAEALGLTGHVHTGAASTMARITEFLGG